MKDRISDIKSTIEKLSSLLEDEILSQRMEINSLKREIADLKLREHERAADAPQQMPLQQTPLPQVPQYEPILEPVPHQITQAPEDDEIIILDKAFKKTPAWMVDIPGEKVESILKIIPLNDKLSFIQNLFGSDEDQFTLTLERIEEMSSFREVVDDMKDAFPEWDDFSDDVYRFYMFVRRKFRD